MEGISEKNNNNSLTIEEENILKESIKFLQEEYKIKTQKLKILKQEVSQIKKLFQSKVSEYQEDIKLIIEKENETEQLFSKISKIKKKRALILKYSFNDKFYHHLLEISANAKKEKILKNFFSLILLDNNLDKRSIQDFIKILRDKDEIKSLLSYTNKIYNNLRNKDENAYLDYKKKYDIYYLELKQLDNSYPFEDLFECLGIIFDVIKNEKLIKDNNQDLNKLTEKKNAKFVEIKFIELKIKNYNKIIKKIRNHIKIIHNFFNNFNEFKISNDKKNYQELLSNLEDYKKLDFDYNNMNSNYDAISSLTFGTYCTQSEESSIKSSNFDSTKKIKLINNKMNGNEEIKYKLNFKDNIGDIFNSILKENKKENKLAKSLNNFKSDKKWNNKLKNNKNEINNNININMINKNKNDNKMFDDDYLEKINNLIDEQNKDENEKNKTKINNNFVNLQKFGLEINEMKDKLQEESFGMANTKEIQTKNNDHNYNYNNQDSSNNDSSVCDEMIASNYESNNMGKSTINDYINKIGIRNNVVLTQELYKNKLFMRKNNKHELKIEKSVDPSTCCASCT